jgi:hypothetical protein
MYGPTIFQLPHLFDLFCRERVPIRVRKMAAGAKVPRYCIISVMRRVLVLRRVMQRKRGEVNGMHVSKWQPDEAGRK